MRVRTQQWLQASLGAVLLAIVLVGGNLLARKFYSRKDFTTERSFELNDATVLRLRTLQRDVTLYLVYPIQEAAQDRCLPAVWQRIQILCDEFQKRSSRVRVVTVSEANPSAIEDIRRHFQNATANSIYVVADLGGERVGKKALGVRFGTFYDGDPKTGRVDNFFGERWLLAALVAATQEKKRVVYSTVGHEEATVHSGISTLAALLEEREGIELRMLPLKDVAGIPLDAEAVLIAGPQKPFESREVDALKVYLQRGGSLFLALTPEFRADLDPLLDALGVEVRRGVVLDNAENYRMDRRFLRVQRFENHEINRGMQNVNMSFIVPLSSVVRRAEKTVPGTTVVPLFYAGPAAWEETGPLNQMYPQPDPVELRSTPEALLPLGVAVTAALPAPAADGRREARVVVWGSSSALNDYNLPMMGRMVASNLEYILNHFRWLLGREELIAIPPKRPGQRPMDLTPSALSRIFWVTTLGFPALGIFVGGIAWFVRRK